MKSKARRAKCIEMAYEYIKNYGPCEARDALVEVNKKFQGEVVMGEMSKYIAYLHATGQIECEMSDGHRIWRAVEA